MATFTFKTKEEYLAYRNDWRIKYMETSEYIRTLKREIKENQRSGNYAGNEQGQREYARIRQRNALSELAEAKLEAARQYSIRKQLEREAA